MKKNYNPQKLFLLICVFISACYKTSTPVLNNQEVTIPESFGKDVVLATGIDFQTGKSVVINPKTGEEIFPCAVMPLIDTKNTSSYGTSRYEENNTHNSKSTTSNKKECNIQIVNPTQELINTFETSQKIINGTVRKDGIDIPARFVITVSALYEGSNCITLITNGGQYQSCSTLKEDCNWLLPLTRYANNNPENVRKNVRKACGEQPINSGDPIPAPSTIPQWKKDWKKADCNNLRLVYRKSPAIPATRKTDGTIVEQPAIYSLDYQKYIWRTCNTVTPPSWGTSP